MNPGKVTLVIEPMVAIINDQIKTLTAKGVDAIALGEPAGKDSKKNFTEFLVCIVLMMFLN